MFTQQRSINISLNIKMFSIAYIIMLFLLTTYYESNVSGIGKTLFENSN